MQSLGKNKLKYFFCQLQNLYVVCKKNLKSKYCFVLNNENIWAHHVFILTFQPLAENWLRGSQNSISKAIFPHDVEKFEPNHSFSLTYV